MGSKARKRSSGPRGRAARLATTILGLAMLAPLIVVAPAAIPSAPFSVKAQATGCVDDNGNVVTCPISVDPIPLPVGKTIGEYELGLASRGASGAVTTQPYEWGIGSNIGACLPSNGACGIQKKIRIGPTQPDPTTGREVPSLVTAPGLTGANKGDAAVVSVDLDGNGQQELVTAARCQRSSEICLSAFDPSTNSYGKKSPDWSPTGLYVDGGVGRIRLAAGMILRTPAVVEGATFSLNPDGGVLATFTTSTPHGYLPGEPIRFANNADLAQAMCPALAQGSVLCGGSTSAQWLPVQSVPSDTEFTVRVGNAIKVGDEVGSAGPQVPDPWPSSPTIGALSLDASAGDGELHVVETGSAPPPTPFDVLVGDKVNGFERLTVTDRAPDASGGNGFVYTLQDAVAADHGVDAEVDQACTGCSLGVTGLRPGVVAAYSAPGKVATIAAFSVRLGRRQQFRLLDSYPLGRLGLDGAREPIDVTTGDFDGDGQDEVAAAWAGSGQGLMRFFAVSDAKQMVPLGTTSAFESDTSPYALSIATGNLLPLPGTNTAGADVAVAWGRSDTEGHEVRVFDVSNNFGLRSMSLQGGFQDGQTFTGQWDPQASYEQNSVVRDDLGFWITAKGGHASCTTDVDSTAKFYFQDPYTAGSAWQSHLPKVLQNGKYVTNWPTPSGIWSSDPQVTGKVGVYALNNFPFGGKRGDGPARAYLDPNPPSASDMNMALYAAIDPPAWNTDVLQGEYVSGPLAEQTIDGRAAAVIAAAASQGAADPFARAQLTIRVVNNDGSIKPNGQGVLYGGQLDDPNQGLIGPSYGASTSVGGTPAGPGRHFPTTDESARSVGLSPVHVDAGDRLLIEVGSRVNINGDWSDSNSTRDAAVWLGVKGQGDLPPIDDVDHLNYVENSPGSGQYHWLDPTLTFTNPIAFDNCTTHVSDEGVRDWQPVPASATLTAWAGPDDVATQSGERTSIRLVASDLNMDGQDELALAQTTPGGFGASLAPTDVQVWEGTVPDCTAPQDPGAAAACPVKNGAPKKMTFQKIASKALSVQSYGADSAGSLALQAGRLGSISSGDPGFPNSVNPDLVVAVPTASGAQVQPIDVCIPGTDQNHDGIDDICPSETRWTLSPTTPASVTGGGSASNPFWNSAEFALPDFDRDSKTLGTPLEYLETGRIQPMMILRSPPVHYDVFDDNGNGTIQPGEMYDINHCFSDYLATGEDYVCHTTSSYGNSTTVDSTVRGEVHTAGSYSWGGNGTVNVGVGGESQGCDGGDGEPVRVNTDDSGWCVEGLFYLNMASSNSQNADLSKDIGRSFSYSSTVTTSAGTDAVYAALQQNEVLEYPVYAGAGWGLGSGDPVQYITQKTPLQTRFRWMSSEDFGVPLTGAGMSPQNVLSYASTEAQLKRQASQMPILGASKAPGGSAIDVQLKGNHGLTCLQTGADVPDGTPIKIDRTDLYSAARAADPDRFGASTYPCAVGTSSVEIQDTHTALDRTYIVTQALSADKLRLQPTVPLGTIDGTTLGQASTGAVVVSPGSFPVDEWTVRRFHDLEAEVVTDTSSGYESSFGWGIGSDLGFGVRIAAAGNWKLSPVAVNVGGSVGFNYSEQYTKDQLQTLTLGTTQETRFGIHVTGDITPNVTYTVRPFLTQAPDGAMVLDWTTGLDGTQPFWHTHYGVLPDPAFALPNLLTPYKAPIPNSHPQATVPQLLQSVDFASWQCEQRVDDRSGLTSYSDCTPSGKAAPDQPMVLLARVHNYALQAYDSDKPIQVRFYVGDPARGGYEVARTQVPSVRSPQCVQRWCLPAQSDAVARVEWDWHAAYPGLAGQGSPIRPLPIYAIIDPANTGAEGHDFTTPVEVRDCAATYPTGDGAGGLDFDASECPTTNNEGYFTQAFGGGGTAASTNLSISPSDVKVLSDGSIQVSVHATDDTGRVEVRAYECGGSVCLPQTLPGAGPLSTRTIAAIPGGGSASTRFVLPLAAGSHTLIFQVVAKDDWEAPGGGPFDADGKLADNQTVVTITK